MARVAIQHLKSETPFDWFILQRFADQGIFQVSGWSILMPHRYWLLTLPFVGVGIIYHKMWCMFISLSIILWSCRRFMISINTQQGVVVQKMILTIPYKRYLLPLSVKVELQSASPSSNPDLYLSHPDLYISPILLTQSMRDRMDQLKYEIEEACIQVQKDRLSSASGREPFSSVEKNTYEWVLCLIEMIPVFIGPHRKRFGTQTELNWWTPNPTDMIWIGVFLSLIPFIACISLSMAIILGCISVFILFTSRDYLYVNSNGIYWEHSLLGITSQSNSWGFPVHFTLNTDIYSPKGFSITLYDRQNTDGAQNLGNPWDSAWIYHELTQAVHRSQSTNHHSKLKF